MSCELLKIKHNGNPSSFGNKIGCNPIKIGSTPVTGTLSVAQLGRAEDCKSLCRRFESGQEDNFSRFNLLRYKL
jgi:hypothetical protein